MTPLPDPTRPTASGAARERPRADIGVLGGSGLYDFLAGADHVAVSTPFGDPSDGIVVGELHGRRVAFLPRHGHDHRFPPHRIPYRANLWALRSLGVRQVLAPCAVGSLRPELGPGAVVLPDQVVDRTWGREHTVYDEIGPVVHVGFAEPYCPRGRAVAARAVAQAGMPLADRGTLVVVNGPRFSSRAESRWHQQAGWSVVGMTGMPEAAIARELALCFTTIALVTDLDAGVEGESGVSHHEVLKVFAQNMERIKTVLEQAVAAMPESEPDDTASCPCRRALDGLTLPVTLPT